MSENYNDTLALFKKLQETGATEAVAQQTPARPTPRGVSGSDIHMLDEAVFGKYNPETDTSTSDGQKKLMDTMKEFESGNVSAETRERVQENISKSKLPKAILESMLAQPLIETNIAGDDIDEFMAKNIKKNANIEASNRIIKKLTESDTPKSSPRNDYPQPGFASIDYDRIQTMINEAVTRMCSQFANSARLNESTNQQAPTLRIIQEVEGSKFLLLDTDDNVYECTLSYKGKNKKH